MSHQHNSECGHEHHEQDGHGGHDHDHDHGPTGPPPNNLYARIDRQNVVALNAEEGSDPCASLKPWHERTEETKVSAVLDARSPRRILTGLLAVVGIGRGRSTHTTHSVYWICQTARVAIEDWTRRANA